MHKDSQTVNAGDNGLGCIQYGSLKRLTCLFASKGNDLKAMIRMDATKEQISEAVRSIWTKRDDAYSQNRGETEIDKVEMSFIGG